MKYLNKEEFLAQHEQMQLSAVMYNTAEVLKWDPKSFLESYEKWIEFNEEELMSDSYGHATLSVCEKVREMLWNLRFLYANEKGIPGPFEGVYPESYRPNIFGDNIAFIEKWNFSRANLNEKNRIMAITQVASICYQSGKSLGSESLYNRLLAESHGLPSSSFEFVPMLLSEKEYWEHVETKLPNGLDINNQLTKFGEWIEDNGKKYLLTNFRAAVYMKEYYPDIDLTGFYNTEAECDIIDRHFNVFLYKVDFPTRSQMVRHRVNWQELSRRYVSGKRVGFDFYISEGMKKVISKQKLNCEIEEWCEDPEDLEVAGQPNVYEPYEKSTHLITAQTAIDICLQVYYDALEQGIKPQEARRIIPQAAYTQIWGAFQPAQLANYFRLRDDSHAQWEIHRTATVMKEMIISLAALKEDMANPERQAEIARRIQSIKDGTCGVIGQEELEQLLAEKELEEQHEQ